MSFVPWIPFAARTFLEAIVQPDWNVFEWGSGGSTIWLAQRTNHITTVEHWTRYRDLLMADLNKTGLVNVDLLFIEAQPGRIHVHPEMDHPDNYFGRPYDQSYDNHNFKAYACAIDRFPARAFDLVFVDGQARSSCIKHGMPKVKLGGYLMADNSDRTQEFGSSFDLFQTTGVNLLWERYDFWGKGPDYTEGLGNVPWSCTIWRRTLNE